jgi:hypothetical protein
MSGRPANSEQATANFKLGHRGRKRASTRNREDHQTSSASPSPIFHIPPRYGTELTRLLVIKGIHCPHHRAARGFYR